MLRHRHNQRIRRRFFSCSLSDIKMRFLKLPLQMVIGEQKEKWWEEQDSNR
jgi:hypothetical protein